MAELRVKSTGTLKLFENDNTSSVTIASPASLGADRTITLPDASVTLASGTMLATDGDGSSLTGLPDNTPYFQVYLSANQTISDATFTTVTFDSEEYDSGSDFASNTFTAPSTGYYYMYSQLGWASDTDATYTLNRLMKNGSAINHNVFVQDASSSGYGGRIISLSASDTVTVQCYQNSGGDLPLYGGAAQACQFGGFKIIT